MHVEQNTDIEMKSVWTVLSTRLYTRFLSPPLVVAITASELKLLLHYPQVMNPSSSESVCSWVITGIGDRVVLISRYNYWPYTVSFISWCDWKELNPYYHDGNGWYFPLITL